MIRTDHTRHIFARFGEPHRMRDYPKRPMAQMTEIEMLLASPLADRDNDIPLATIASMTHEHNEI